MCEEENSTGDTDVALEPYKLLRHRLKLYVQQCSLKDISFQSKH